MTQCEFWSGEDFVRAKGSVEISAPAYLLGEIQARTKDVSAYRDFFKGLRTPKVRAGAVQIRWQGDGNASAHSGAFNVSLENFISELRPAEGPVGLPERILRRTCISVGSGVGTRFAALTTRATLARSGIKLDDARLRASGRQLPNAEIYLPLDPFDVAAGEATQECPAFG